jgi:alpha-glucuronidase
MALEELRRGLGELYGVFPTVGKSGVGLFRCSELPEEGYERLIKGDRLILRAGGDRGLLYGVFDLLRDLALGREIEDKCEQPFCKMRMLNHWDNMDLSFAKTGEAVERGYAGASVFHWTRPFAEQPRVLELARVYASIGLNHCCINNVNADPRYLTDETLPKLKELAEIFRPWGIRLWISVNFAAPISLGGLESADPLDAEVVAWWRERVDAFYAAIPDFGGFVVKANSEGEPGPNDYGRDHDDGANLFARLLAPYGGQVIWRTFVYGNTGGRSGGNFTHFHNLDGSFDENVILQVKHGPIDFQPNEPPHPLFGNMPKTPLILELQAAQEYTGQGVYTFYWGPLWSKILQTPMSEGCLSDLLAETGLAVIPGLGMSEWWTPHPLAAVNVYLAGALAWNPGRDVREIAEEWAGLTFGSKVASEVADVLMRSYDAYVNLTGPYGLYMLHALDHFYPEPGRLLRSDVFNETILGYPRGAGTRGEALSDWPEPQRSLYSDVATCPEEWLLFFHQLPHDHPLRDGRGLLDAVMEQVESGKREMEDFLQKWSDLEGQIPKPEYRVMISKFQEQVEEAENWRETLAGFFEREGALPIRVS